MGMPETRGRTRGTEKETEKKTTKLGTVSLRNRVWLHCGISTSSQLGQHQACLLEKLPVGKLSKNFVGPKTVYRYSQCSPTAEEFFSQNTEIFGGF